MKNLMVLLGLALGLSTLAAPATARNFDCTKAGNANKAVCKKPIAKPAAGPKKSKTVVSSAITTNSTSRHFDCSKLGNKSKAVCKTSANPTSAEVTKTTTTSLKYDCTKFYNRLRAACRTQSTSSSTNTAAITPARPSMNRPVATRARTTNTASRSVNGDAMGATAQCKDGSYSHAPHHSGACSHHGGVAKFLS